MIQEYRRRRPPLRGGKEALGKGDFVRMKVLMINSSPHEKGCTNLALETVAEALAEFGVGSEIVQLGTAAIRDCVACGACRRMDNGKCAYSDDIINSVIEKAETANGFVFGSPVYYAHPSGRLLSALDRIFCAGNRFFVGKPGAAVVSARRGGTTASLDVINKYFTITQMPVVSSNYWNMIHGNNPEEAAQDLEGLQTMRVLGGNMAWLLRCIDAGREAGIRRPETEKKVKTNFIR